MARNQEMVFALGGRSTERNFLLNRCVFLCASASYIDNPKVDVGSSLCPCFRNVFFVVLQMVQAPCPISRARSVDAADIDPKML